MRKILKQRILKSWEYTIENSQYLWKLTAEHIYNILVTKTEKEAIKIFTEYRNKYRNMACSGYYDRVLQELTGKEFIET
jgi:hypothetical protein